MLVHFICKFQFSTKQETNLRASLETMVEAIVYSAIKLCIFLIQEQLISYIYHLWSVWHTVVLTIHISNKETKGHKLLSF